MMSSHPKICPGPALVSFDSVILFEMFRAVGKKLRDNYSFLACKTAGEADLESFMVLWQVKSAL